MAVTSAAYRMRPFSGAGRTPTDRSDLRADIVWMAALGALAVAYFLLVVAFDSRFFFPVPDGITLSAFQVWGTIALLLAQVSVVPLRRRHPIVVFAVIVVLLLLAEVLAGDRNLVLNLTVLFGAWNLTASLRISVWLPVIVLAIASDVTTQLVLFAIYGPVTPYAVFAVVLRTVITFGIAIPAGLFVRSLRRSAQLSAEIAASREREHEARVSAAIATERTRMARELHDVAAYHLSGIVLQASAVKEVIDDDPATASELADSIRAESELTVQSLREVIGVLRTADVVSGDTAPVARLPDLVAELRAAHPSVRFALRGRLDDIPAAVALAAFRIVQESLTNALKHAPGAEIEVTVVRERNTLTVAVLNEPASLPLDPALSNGGYGLIGMRERISILGGDLTAGATDDGGWLTRAIMPTGGGLS